jgi:hypothetical protein
MFGVNLSAITLERTVSGKPLSYVARHLHTHVMPDIRCNRRASRSWRFDSWSSLCSCCCAACATGISLLLSGISRLLRVRSELSKQQCRTGELASLFLSHGSPDVHEALVEEQHQYRECEDNEDRTDGSVNNCSDVLRGCGTHYVAQKQNLKDFHLSNTVIMSM